MAEETDINVLYARAKCVIPGLREHKAELEESVIANSLKRMKAQGIDKLVLEKNPVIASMEGQFAADEKSIVLLVKKGRVDIQYFKPYCEAGLWKRYEEVAQTLAGLKSVLKYDSKK